MSWVDAYDLETVNKDFELVDYAFFDDEPAEEREIASVGLVSVLQEGLLRIWEFTYSLYETEEEVTNYVQAELRYAAVTWEREDVGTRMFYHLKRLQAFVRWERHSLNNVVFKGFIEKCVMKLLKYYTDDKADVSLKIKRLLLEILSATDQGIKHMHRTTRQREGGRGSLLEEVLPPLDLEELRRQAGLPVKPKRKDQLARERQEGSLFSDLHSPAFTPQFPDTSILHSIYKDSAKYKHYTKYFRSSTDPLGETGQLKTPQKDLERLDNLNELAEDFRIEEFLTKRMTRFRLTEKRPTRIGRTSSRDLFAWTIREEPSNWGSVDSERQRTSFNEAEESWEDEPVDDLSADSLTHKMKVLSDLSDLSSFTEPLRLQKSAPRQAPRAFGRPLNQLK